MIVCLSNLLPLLRISPVCLSVLLSVCLSHLLFLLGFFKGGRRCCSGTERRKGRACRYWAGGLETILHNPHHQYLWNLEFLHQTWQSVMQKCIYIVLWCLFIFHRECWLRGLPDHLALPWVIYISQLFFICVWIFTNLEKRPIISIIFHFIFSFRVCQVLQVCKAPQALLEIQVTGWEFILVWPFLLVTFLFNVKLSLYSSIYITVVINLLNRKH